MAAPVIVVFFVRWIAVADDSWPDPRIRRKMLAHLQRVRSRTSQLVDAALLENQASRASCVAAQHAI
jgi:hypothetical protein